MFDMLFEHQKVASNWMSSRDPLASSALLTVPSAHDAFEHDANKHEACDHHHAKEATPAHQHWLMCDLSSTDMGRWQGAEQQILEQLEKNVRIEKATPLVLHD